MTAVAAGLLALAMMTPAVSYAETETETEAASGPAQAADPRLASTYSELQGLVVRLNDVASSLDSTFTLATLPTGSNSVHVWTTSGRLSPELQDLISVLGHRVVVERSVVDADQIESIGSTVEKLVMEGSQFGAGTPVRGFEIDYVGPVRILAGTETDGAEAEIRRALSAFPAASVTVQFNAGDVDRSAFYQRTDDAPPYRAGGLIREAGTGDGCSSGFMGRSTVNGDTYMLTAEHCVNNSDPRFWDGGHDFIGTATGRDGRYDVAAIKVAGAAQTYTGIWSSGTLTTVSGVVSPTDAVHQQVCTSGAISGTRCNGATVRSQAFLPGWCNGGRCWDYMVLWSARLNNGPVVGCENAFCPSSLVGSPLAGGGDSGGPVYLARHQTGGLVNAIGLVQGRIEDYPLTPCAPSNPEYDHPNDPVDRVCSPDIYFTDVNHIANIWQLDLTF